MGITCSHQPILRRPRENSGASHFSSGSDSSTGPTLYRPSLSTITMSLPLSPPSSPNASNVWVEGRVATDIGNSAYLIKYYDNREFDRQNTTHFLMKAMYGKNFLTPVEELQKTSPVTMLDIGCSTGTWCIDVALENPSFHVYGIDIIPSFPADIKPDNVTFQKANATQIFPFPDETFSLVHIRFMILAFREDELRHVLKESYRVLRKGGYIEFLDADLTPHRCGTLYKEWTNKTNKALAVRGFDLKAARNIGDIFKKVGFVKPETSYMSMPHGSWCKEGKIQANSYMQQYGIATEFFRAALGMSAETYQSELTAAFEDLNNHQGYYNYYSSFAKKPLI